MKLKKSELRIGNYVQYPLLAVSAIDSGEEIDRINDAAGQPIHITVEWLVKFGFEKHKTEKGYGLTKKPLTFYVHVVDGEEMISYPSYLKKSPIELIVNFVHELQNLYFALTGKELKIKK